MISHLHQIMDLSKITNIDKDTIIGNALRDYNSELSVQHDETFSNYFSENLEIHDYKYGNYVSISIENLSLCDISRRGELYKTISLIIFNEIRFDILAQEFSYLKDSIIYKLLKFAEYSPRFCTDKFVVSIINNDNIIIEVFDKQSEICTFTRIPIEKPWWQLAMLQDCVDGLYNFPFDDSIRIKSALKN
jgi:hypothetical protein